MHVCIVNRYAAPCSCEKATFTLQSEAPWEWNSLAQFALGSQSKKEIKIISFLRCQILLIVISCIPRARCTFAPQKHPGKLTMCLLSVIKAEFLGSAVLYVVACESLKHCYVGARTCKNTSSVGATPLLLCHKQKVSRAALSFERRQLGVIKFQREGHSINIPALSWGSLRILPRNTRRSISETINA